MNWNTKNKIRKTRELKKIEIGKRQLQSYFDQKQEQYFCAMLMMKTEREASSYIYWVLSDATERKE